MHISRRGFLKVSLAGGAGVALAQTSRLFGGAKTLDRIDRLGEPDLHRDFPEEWIPSVCGACPAACPIFLRKIGENIVGIRPSEPKPCPRAYLIPQELVHPDRALVPLKRQGERGSGSWKRISRTTAVEELTNILRDSGKKTAIVAPENSGLSFVLLKALINALGSHHIYTDEWTLAQGPIDALQLATGWEEWRYDLSNADGIISFGWDWLQNFSNPTEAQTAFGRLREKNAPMIYVGPRLNLTAMRSNNWIACRSGMEPLVALSLAYLLLVEKKYDSDFCKSAEGFAPFTDGLAKFDLADAERQTGVSVQRLLEVADIISQRRPFLCLASRGRLEDQWPIVALNALLGNFNKPGSLIPIPEVSLPATRQDREERKSGRIGEWENGRNSPTHPLTHSPTHFSMEELPQLLMDGSEVETVIFVGVNPAFSSPSPSRWQKALKKARHVVCLTHFFDETSEFADLLIPLALPVERAEIYIETDGEKAAPRKVESAISPPPEVFSPVELAFELAQRLGIQNRFLYKSLEEAANALVLHLPPTISFRFPDDSAFRLPPSAFSLSEGDFHLLLEAPFALARAEGARFPYLITTLAPHLREWWTTWMEINPKTAKRLGIHDKEEVVVEVGAIHELSLRSIQVRARLFEGVPPDAICLPMGMGHKLGQFAQSEGGNPMELIEYKRDETTGIPLWNFQKVRIRKSVTKV